MNEIIKTTTNDSGEIVVSGRELHEVLEVKTDYKDWFPRMLDYGFVEGIDYAEYEENVQAQNRARTYKQKNHVLKLDMAKEIAMIQRSEKGKDVRKYFLDLERQWNSPEMVMKRAMDYLNAKIDEQQKEISEYKPKATYYDLILQSKDLIAIGKIAKDYGMSAQSLNKLLHEEGIQYKRSGQWLLYSKYQNEGYAASKTQTVSADKTTIHTYWTQKGRVFIHNLLSDKGIKALIDR